MAYTNKRLDDNAFVSKLCKMHGYSFAMLSFMQSYNPMYQPIAYDDNIDEYLSFITFCKNGNDSAIVFAKTSSTSCLASCLPIFLDANKAYQASKHNCLDEFLVKQLEDFSMKGYDICAGRGYSNPKTIWPKDTSYDEMLVQLDLNDIGN